VKCWGYNNSGQLGDGSSGSGANSTTPVDVAGLTSGVVQISMGGFHACAVTETGGVKCWGSNAIGQLGDGTSTSSSTPVDVAGLTSGAAEVVASDAHTCALMEAGGVKCWGWNGFGQLGDGTLTSSSTPVDVSGLSSGVTTLAGSGSHTCVVVTGGAMECWGRNDRGQIGDGTATNRSVPVEVVGLDSGVATIGAGLYHTCVVDDEGAAKCWGRNDRGQIGDGTTTDRSVPVEVFGLGSSITSAGAGSYHTCAVTAVGGAKCWGDGDSGELGNGGTSDSATPLDVSA
jgi:alpha-tubulin suppressor-like RCC1 family protein